MEQNLVKTSPRLGGAMSPEHAGNQKELEEI